MVKELNIIDVASLFAINDTKAKYNIPEGVSPENWKGSCSNDYLSAIEFYNMRYDYYFETLLDFPD